MTTTTEIISAYNSSNWTVPTLPSTSRVAMYTRCLRSMTMTDDHERTGLWGSRKYICNDCQRTFALKASLVRHKMFECNNKQQNNRHGTTNNQKTNTNNPNSKTTLAAGVSTNSITMSSSSSSSSSSSLSNKTTIIPTTNSMASIIVERKRSTSRHICPNCRKSYAFFTSLWRHQHYECGIEPQFSCPICKSKFAQKSNLDRHVRTKH
ncbi:PREDICTED: zinc finger protein Xfin-like [Polistes canadensis]|uniref:zinc finger protein Xfin-like n=1 Tax=Polistes canadensis TaxID=91411 RepID=UPI000718ABEC|nr:PREDICTED: zinc finger protein Xfin-like [Polistes canadensis]